MSDFDNPDDETPSSAPLVGTEGDLPPRDASAPDRSTEESDLPPETLLDQNLDETNVEDALRARGGVTVNMLASMASLDVVIPGGGALQGLYDTLFRSKEMNDDFSISNLGGSLDQYFLYQAGEVDEDGRKIRNIDGSDDDDGWDEYAEIAEERHEREERMREEWAETEHDYAGVEMTGAEWGQLAVDVGPNGKLHQKLVQWYVNYGRTPAEAEQKATEDYQIYSIEAKPASQRTTEEQERLNAAGQDSEFREATRYVHDQRAQSFRSYSSFEQTSVSSNQTASVTAGAAVFDADPSAQTPMPPAATPLASATDDAGSDFPSAPDLTAHHQAAVAAVEPLDSARPQPQVAAIPPTPAPGGGFDV